jgi:hypothetical protein
LVKDGNGDLVPDSNNMWNNYFSKLLTIDRVIDVRKKEIHIIQWLRSEMLLQFPMCINDSIFIKLWPNLFKQEVRYYSKIRFTTSRRTRWAGQVARMLEKRNACRILVGKPE